MNAAAHNPRARRGVLLIYVLVIVAALGAAAAVLTDACASLAFEARETYLDACARNLAASAAAWADRNGAAVPAEGRELDVSALGVPGARLSVAPAAAPGRVEIRLSCRHGKRIVTGRVTRFAPLPR